MILRSLTLCLIVVLTMLTIRACVVLEQNTIARPSMEDMP